MATVAPMVTMATVAGADHKGRSIIGGMVFARADNHDVNSLRDIKGKTITSTW
jgi:hypothetical protein